MEKDKLKDTEVTQTQGIYKHTPENLNQIKVCFLKVHLYELQLVILVTRLVLEILKEHNIEISIELSKCST